LGGWVTFGAGDYEKGVDNSRKSLELDPDNPYSNVGLAEHNLALGRLTETETALRRAAERKLENPDLAILRYYLAFHKGDQAGMEREVRVVEKNPQTEASILQYQAMSQAHSGRMKQAEAMWQRAVALARQRGALEPAALYESSAAFCEAILGNAGEARRHAFSALDLARSRDVDFASTVALMRSGDSSGVRSLAEGLAKRFPEDLPTQFEYLPTLHALLAIERKDPVAAIAALEAAKLYDFAMPGTAFHAKFGGLHTVYVRGEAYLAAHQGAEAAVEFQKILDHFGVLYADPVGVLAYLQLGRAFVLSGDTAKAMTSYQKFLTLWKDADPDLPILQQARTEYSKLQKAKPETGRRPS
jgi:tetratricopeptide (TPR) repeat protein